MATIFKQMDGTVFLRDLHLKTGLIGAWFATSFLGLLFAVGLLIYISTPKVVQLSNHNFKLYTAIPASEVSVEENINYSDARAKIIEDFFKGYKTPLASYAQVFITVADKYKLDYRLLPAISMQESNGGKRIIKDSYNAFGYGIYGSQVLKFTSWEEAIDRVGRGLREDYLDEGLNTPEKIMAKYTPPSLAKGGTWAKGVSAFMEELR